jgi:hypothetical protein
MKNARYRPLAFALLANAVFSGAAALVLLVFPETLAPELGGVAPALLRGVGVGLAGFVALLATAIRDAAQPRPRGTPALAAVVLDGGWVLGTAALLPFVWGHVSPAGLVLFAGVGIVVAGVAAAQWRGIDRLFAEPDASLGTTHRVEVWVDADVPASRMWPVIADLGGIDAHLESLAEAAVEGTPGPGAVRTCANHQGQRWSEEVTDWRPGHALSLRFRTEQPGFPYPMFRMLGGWRLTPRGPNRTGVVVWWSFTPRPRWLAPAMVPIMLRQVRRDMEATVASMARTAGEDSPDEPSCGGGLRDAAPEAS